MRRDLPSKASLEHLKKQAKDLLDAHRRADPVALARIRDAVPAFAGMSDEAIARAPFALHDAQSAVAREYNTKSWNELREAVASQSANGPSDALLRALMPFPFPPEVGAKLRESANRRTVAAAVESTPLPPALPLLPLRNALFLPRALGPIHLSRPSSRAAVVAALTRTPPTAALFAQRDPDEESIDAAALHPVGCEVYLHARLPDGETREWVVLEGIRWIALESLETDPSGYPVAVIGPVRIELESGPEVSALSDALRNTARGLASAFPDAARLIALIDTADPERLADLVVANVPASVDDKARYAAEPRLGERLRMASEMVARRVAG